MARDAVSGPIGRRRGPDRRPRKRGRKATKGGFKQGQNGHDGTPAHRGPDIIPRKQVVATAQAAMLFGEQLRDPRTGRLSKSKWAKGVLGAGMRDYIKAGRRGLYALGHGDANEGATIVAGVVRIGEFFGAYLDDKPSGPTRVTKIILSTEEPSQEVPPDTGRRRLKGTSSAGQAAAEDGYVEVREEDVT